jgi:hypothetical protein
MRNLGCGIGLSNCALATSGEQATYLVQERFDGGDESNPIASPHGALTAVQNDGDFEITGDEIVATAQSTPTWGDLVLRTTNTFTRKAGTAFLIKVKKDSTVFAPFLGISGSNAFALTTDDPQLYFWSTGLLAWVSSLGQSRIGTIAADTWYEVVIIVRVDGCFFAIKGGIYTDWTIVWETIVGNDSDIYAGISAYNDNFWVDDFEIVESVDTSDMLLLSDTFTRANSNNIGSTDGLAAEEIGGDGIAWEDHGTQTCSISTNRLTAEWHDGTFQYAIAETNQSDINIEIDVESDTYGVWGGTAFRWTDFDNHWMTYRSDAYLRLVEKEAGSSTTRASDYDVTYDSGVQPIRVSADDEEISVHIGGEYKFTYAGAVTNKTATKHGCIVQWSGTNFIHEINVWKRHPELTLISPVSP